MKKIVNGNFIHKITFAIALIICGAFTHSGSFCAQGWAWAKSQGGINSDASRVVCTDPSGNVIVAGGFANPSVMIGTISVNSAGMADIYLAKFDPAGNVLWVQTIGGPGGDFVGGVCTSTNGNIFVSGSYNSSTLTLASLTLPQTSTVSTNNDVFLAEYSPSGSIQWATKLAGAGNEFAEGCTYSSALNNVILTGYFYGSTVTAGPYMLTNTSASGSNDIFVYKFNTTFGSPVGAFSAGGANSGDYGYDVRADATSIYLGGTFSPSTGSTSTIGTVVTTYGSQDVFLAKYNNAGTFQWVRTGGSASTNPDFFGGLDMDASGNCYIAGGYNAMPMIIGTSTLATSGLTDAFIAKYNSAGTFQWANKLGGTGADFGYDVTVDANSNSYLTGYFAGTTATTGSYTLTNSTPGVNQDIFVAKYNSAGTPQWATSAPGADVETAYAIASDAPGNVYVAGAYNIAGPMAFNTTTLNSAGNNDGFLAKLGCLTAIIGGVSNVCAGTSATLTAGGATNYTWSTGATTSSIVITPTANATYTVIGATGSCTDVSNPYNITVLPANLNPGPGLNLLCKQSQAMNVSCTPASPTSVTWTPAVGLTNASVLNPAVTATASPGTYSIAVTLNNGCVVKGTVGLTRYAQKPDICLATVDSLGLNNDIFWDKTLYQQADSFIIYREVSTNIYKRIAALSVSVYSGFTDTVRSVGPANGDPNTTSYKYKLQIRDSCGNYSALSYWHQTVFIQDQQNGNFNWNPYAIESSGTPVSVYDLYRISLANNTYSLVTSTTAGLATDPQYSSWQTTAKWRVQANGFTCNPTLRVASPLDLKIKTKSNIKNDRLVAGIKAYDALKDLVVMYPSPAKEIVFIEGKVLSNNDLTIEMQNALGQEVYSKNYSANAAERYQIDVTAFDSGVYFINIKQNNRTLVVKKVIVNK